MALAFGCGGGPGPDGSLVGGGEGGTSAGAGGAPGGGGAGSATNGGTGAFFPIADAGVGGSTPTYVEQNLVEFRVEPANALIAVGLGQSEQVEYRAFGRFADDPDTEVELTERSVFYVPDNYLVAAFPADGASTLTTRLPAAVDDPEQRGGTLTVRAQAANTDGSVSTATTQLTVTLTGAIAPPQGSNEATPPLPVEPAEHFRGPADDARAPRLAYPNNGVLLPPNLGQLEVHFQPGAGDNSLFQVRFESATSEVSYYTRCYSDPAQFVAGACALRISGPEFANLAASNQGVGPVKLSVRGSNEAGAYGESDTFQIEFAAQRIDGAVYYWTTSNDSSIERFDFGSGQAQAETFVKPSSVPNNNGSCVGCHALSRQGDKAFFSLGNSDRGELMFMSDLTRSATEAASYAYNGAALDLTRDLEDRENRVLTGSFNPDGSQFVAVAPVNDAAADQTLFFHSGTTGVREGTLSLPFIPSQPDWSPAGDKIAVTALGRNSATITFLDGSIRVIEKQNGAWNAEHPVTVVPAAAGKSRFNPTFFPDASVLLFSEVDQGSYSGSHVNSCNEASVTGSGRFCNGYSDPGAETWAVVPEAGETPVRLAHAAMPGVADVLYPPSQPGVGAGDLMDTYPKPAPFMIEHRGKTLGWFTVGSQRRAGLRKAFTHASVVGDEPSQALLWMFALDATAVASGEDGSYPGFFLPFQDLTTSNHMAQWTQRIVSDEPPPVAPTPPPPAPPPAPPPPPAIIQ